jgi:hypothetical protein
MHFSFSLSENQGPLNVSIITCLSSAGPTQMTWGWASNDRNTWSLLILNKFNEKCITLVLLYWSTMHGQQDIKEVQCGHTAALDPKLDYKFSERRAEHPHVFVRTSVFISWILDLPTLHFEKRSCDVSVYLIISYTASFFPDGHNTTLFRSLFSLLYLIHSISFVFISLLWCLVLFEFGFVSAVSLQYLLLPISVYSLAGFTFVNFPSKIQTFRVVAFI